MSHAVGAPVGLVNCVLRQVALVGIVVIVLLVLGLLWLRDGTQAIGAIGSGTSIFWLPLLMNDLERRWTKSGYTLDRAGFFRIVKWFVICLVLANVQRLLLV